MSSGVKGWGVGEVKVGQHIHRHAHGYRCGQHVDPFDHLAGPVPVRPGCARSGVNNQLDNYLFVARIILGLIQCRHQTSNHVKAGLQRLFLTHPGPSYVEVEDLDAGRGYDTWNFFYRRLYGRL